MVLAMLSFISCHKTSTSCVNTITVTDGSNTYSACIGPLYTTGAGQPHAVSAIFYKGIFKSLLIIDAGIDYPFSINLQDSTILNGVGNDTIQLADSNYNTYTENFSGGQSYKCSGGIICVTNCDSTNIAGTFVLDLFNATSAKLITGTFNIDQPSFQ